MFLEFQCCMFERLMDYFALVTDMISLHFFFWLSTFLFLISVQKQQDGECRGSD